MRFAAEQVFRAAVSDTVIVQDPWGMDLHLEIFREGAKELRRLVREEQRKNPIAHALKLSILKLGVSRFGQKTIAIEDFQNQMEKDLEKASPSADQLDEFFAAERRAAAMCIKSWSGKGVLDVETNKPIPCTDEAKVELLESVERIPDGQPMAGLTLGEALIRLVLDASAGADVSRDRYLAELGKGSGSTSDGSSEPGPTIPESELASAS